MGKDNQGRLLGRGSEGQPLQAREESETDGMSNTLEGTEPKSLGERETVREMGLGAYDLGLST